MSRARAASVLCVLTACGPEAPPADVDACSEGVASSPLTAVDRKILGDAAPYPADGTLRARDKELRRSIALRREVAWGTVAKVLTQVPLSEALPGGASLPTSVPAWQTWHDLDDLTRVFRRLYEGLTPAERAERQRFSEQALDDAFGWNLSAVDELPNWPAERYQEYLSAIDEASEVGGLGGISRVLYSPSAARHLIESYPEILACNDSGPPPAQALGPKLEVTLARVPTEAAACSQTLVGSYGLAAGESIRASLEGADGGTIQLRAEGTSCSGDAEAGCELSGPAVVDVFVQAGAKAIAGVTEVTRTSAQPEWSACLDGPFPLDAVVVKADYRRADFDLTLPVFDTSAAALASRLASGASWATPDGEADPQADEIHTVTLPSGERYRLAALHIMTKELDHWQWVTLWWSSDPDQDFGADRPRGVPELTGPFSHYKMCVATAFREGDPLPGGGFDDAHPSLAAALGATSQEGAPSWCSNPYLEEGDGNARTNCVGCHQHAGSEITSVDALANSDLGRTLARNNFPTDYSWAVTSGDSLVRLFSETEKYFQTP